MVIRRLRGGTMRDAGCRAGRVGTASARDVAPAPDAAQHPSPSRRIFGSAFTGNGPRPTRLLPPP